MINYFDFCKRYDNDFCKFIRSEMIKNHNNKKEMEKTLRQYDLYSKSYFTNKEQYKAELISNNYPTELAEYLCGTLKDLIYYNAFNGLNTTPTNFLMNYGIEKLINLYELMLISDFHEIVEVLRVHRMIPQCYIHTKYRNDLTFFISFDFMNTCWKEFPFDLTIYLDNAKRHQNRLSFDGSGPNEYYMDDKIKEQLEYLKKFV